MWKYEKEFRAAHPETIGETDKEYDLDNYKDWLENKLSMTHDAVLAEVRAAYDDLLIEAMDLYQYYPNNFRKTAEEYFKKEIELQKKLGEHFS